MKTFTVTETIHKGIRLVKGQELAGIQIGQGITKSLEDLPEGTVLMLHNLDLVNADNQMPRLVRELNPRDRAALVSVEVACGESGSTKLYANTVSEKWDETKKRVIREARPIEEAVGVTVHCSSMSDSGLQYLISMQPGSSFRVVRSGDLQGAAPELVVLWNGRWDERAIQQGGRSNTANWGMNLYSRRVRHGEV